jgi:hypothetical protein
MTTGSCSGQTFLVQLETALHRLVESFWEEPYRYFTEADAVSRPAVLGCQAPGAGADPPHC